MADLPKRNKAVESIKILDCTLRDGGYYNDWDFSLAFARALVSGLNAAGVDIVEMGYKSLRRDRYYGLFHFCSEELLAFLKDYPSAEYAFMIDAKEFVAKGAVDEAGLASVVPARDRSLFTWVRIASHFAGVPTVPAFVRYFRDRGYKVSVNLMGMSLLSPAQLGEALATIGSEAPDVFYLADSFGSLYPDDARALIRTVRSTYSGALGIHTHDNQGMAYANTLAAIEEGVEFVDGTVTGMGRGAGNLVLEQLLQGRAGRAGESSRNATALLPVIDEFVMPLKHRYNWGFNHLYMFSGLKNIHPTYCQTLFEGARYTTPQMSMILDRIPLEHRAVFDPKVFTAAVREVLDANVPETKQQRLERYKPVGARSTLIVAGGPSLAQHAEALHAFIRDTGCTLIECNDTGLFNRIEDRLVVVLNKVKLTNYLTVHGTDHPSVVTGEAFIGSDLPTAEVRHLDYELAPFAVSAERVKIPDYDAGMFAMGIAALNGASTVYVAGFDGFDDAKKNATMDDFFASINSRAPAPMAVTALTPTAYQNVARSSVYAFLTRPLDD